MDAIAGAGMTDNVIDLMTRKVERTAGRSTDEIAADLREAVGEGLVLPGTRRAVMPAEDGGGASGETVYTLLHDRVQQAAYARIPERTRSPGFTSPWGVRCSNGTLLTCTSGSSTSPST
jgi:hypothetical protein